jgi:hypothetical protein
MNHIIHGAAFATGIAIGAIGLIALYRWIVLLRDPDPQNEMA